MQVNVIDRLSTIWPTIEDEAVSGLSDSKIKRKIASYKNKLAYQLSVAWSEIIDRWNSAPRDYDDMSRRLRVDVPKGDDLSILMKDGCRDFMVRDLLEECHGAILVLGGCQLNGVSSSELANR